MTTMQRGLGIAAGLTGMAALLAGAAALKWYIWDIAIQEAGASDRSMLFWGIPVVFVGLGAAAAGILLLRLARQKLGHEPPAE